MARETKVGLLAGLAFIICFAVILANRGREEAPTTGVSLADTSSQLPTALHQVATRAISGPSAPARPGHPPQDSQITQSPSTADASAAPGIVFSETTNLPRSSGTSLPPGLVEVPQRPLSSSSAPAAPELTASAAGSALPSSTPTIQPAAQRVAYTVGAGDTLSKIALAHFGNKSGSTIKAIVDANSAVLQNPDQLRAGTVLALPMIDKKAPTNARQAPTDSSSAEPGTRAQADAAKTAAAKKNSDKAASPAFRWYQVKKKDRYTSIAREQLGDADRWRELHEMNKDKFPDPQMIREGVRIKLPVTKTSASAAGRPERMKIASATRNGEPDR